MRIKRTWSTAKYLKIMQRTIPKLLLYCLSLLFALVAVPGVFYFGCLSMLSLSWSENIMHGIKDVIYTLSALEGEELKLDMSQIADIALRYR